MSHELQAHSQSSLPSEARHYYFLILLVAAFALASSSCQPESEAPPEEPDVSESVGLAISAECRLGSDIGPRAPAPEDDWQSVNAASAPACFSMAATDGDNWSIATDTTFVFESVEEIDPEQLAAALAVEPQIEFEVAPMGSAETRLPRDLPGRDATHAEGARSWLSGLITPARVRADGPHEYTVRPSQPLAPGQVYRFALMDVETGERAWQWAFQTRIPLRVLETIPENGTSGVPLATGIELLLSSTEVEGAETAVAIDPPTALADVELTHGRLVLVPEEHLQPATLYTVTVDDSLRDVETGQSLAEAFTLQFETGLEDERSQIHEEPQLAFAHPLYEAPTGEIPTLSLVDYSGQTTDLREGTTVTVYRYEDLDAFAESLVGYAEIPLWAYSSRESYAGETQGLTRVSSFAPRLEPIGDGPELVLQLPEPLEPGFYLITLDQGAGLATRTAWLQVTDIASYAAVAEDRLLVWLNDVSSGVPITNAQISTPEGDIEARPDAQGVVLVDTPPSLLEVPDASHAIYASAVPQVSGLLLVEASGGREAVVPVAEAFRDYRGGGLREMGRATAADDYWRFLYTDRKLYRMSDQIRVWGIARHRDRPEVEQTVKVELLDSGAPGRWGEPTVLARTESRTGGAGTFVGSLSFEGASPGFYTLRLSVDDAILTTTSVEVRDFVKPAYKIDVIPGAEAVIAGEPVDVEIETSFFEGSPVPGMNLVVSGDEEATLTTDETGRAAFAYSSATDTGPAGSYQGYRWASFYVTPELAEAGDIQGQGWLRVFPSQATLDAEWSHEDGNITVAGTVHELDLTRLNEGTAANLDDYLGPPLVGEDVEIRVTEIDYRRVEAGESYNYIEKRVVKEYYYEPIETIMATFSTATDSEGAYQLSFAAEENLRYEILVSVADDAGRSAQRELYAAARSAPGASRPTLSASKAGPYSLGETIDVEMQYGSEPLPSDDGNRYLFYESAAGIRGYEVEEAPVYTFEFRAEQIPNINIVAVRFAGHTYQEASFPLSLPFNREERELVVQATPLGEYGPGEEAVIELQVTDAAGEPKPAHVLLSGVDEAIYRLQGASFYGSTDILNELYATMRTGILRTYASHQLPGGPPGAEGGGGGEARDDFKDTALFEEVVTDADGRARVEFRLPDNLTSWRITSLAASEDFYAGSSAVLLPVSLPMFVEMTASASYLAGDRPVMRVRAYGRGLEEGDPVELQIDAPTLLDEALILEGEAFIGTDVGLPDLATGQHWITVTATAGALADSLVRTVEVVPSRLTVPETSSDEYSAGDTLELQPDSGSRTTVVIADAGRGRYYGALRSLAVGWGDRLDQALGRQLAMRLLEQHFDEGADSRELQLGPWRSDDGGLALVPWGGSDLAASALAAAVAPNDVGRQGMSRYFREIYYDADEPAERRAAALYGLAAVGEPVMPEVAALASASDSQSAFTRTYVALAAAELGDLDTAREMYGALVGELGEARGSAARIGAAADRADTIAATALAAHLGAMLGDELAPAFFEYVSANASPLAPHTLEKAGFLAEALPRLTADPARVTYTHDGRETEVVLERGDSIALALGARDGRGLSLEVIEGVISVATSRDVAVEPTELEPDPDALVTRRYVAGSADQVGATPLAAGAEQSLVVSEADLVRVTLDYRLEETATDGCYQVTDILPSGLLPVTDPYSRGVTPVGPEEAPDYPYAIEGRRVSFCAFRDGEQEPLTYYARVVGKGTYSAEQALIRSQLMAGPQMASLSPPAEVEIR